MPARSGSGDKGTTGEGAPGELSADRPSGTTPGGSSGGSGSGGTSSSTSSGGASAFSDSGSAEASDAQADSMPGTNPADATTGGGDASASGAIAATPPLGWNSWNTFECNLSEDLIKATADAMVSSGMHAAGFEYVNLDDCWMNGRDASGNLQWNASQFPSGIPALATYVHGKGLKLGIYETPNTVTCVGHGGVSHSVAVGSLGHEAQDARTFASWGVDYLKYDLCQGQPSSFAVMRDALRATGRPIVYSINPGNGSGCPPTGPTTSRCGLNLPSIANLWRIAFDINASWSSITTAQTPPWAAMPPHRAESRPLRPWAGTRGTRSGATSARASSRRRPTRWSAAGCTRRGSST